MHEEWGWLIAVYLFLGGLGAGACMVAAFLEFFGKESKCDCGCPVTLVGATLPGPLLLIGTVLLIFDLGQGLQKPLLIINLWTHFSSVMTWGVWILTFFIPLAFVYGFLEVMHCYPETWERIINATWIKKREKFYNFIKDIPKNWVKKVVAGISGFLALCVALYTGLLISAVGPAIPFWQSPNAPFIPLPILPLLFLASALSTGIAVSVDLVDSLLNHDSHDHIQSLPVIHIIVILFEALFVFLLINLSTARGGAAAQSAADVTSGPYSLLFWVFLIIPGIILPLLLQIFIVAGVKNISKSIYLVSAVLVLFAGLFLRYIVIAAGIHAFL